MDCSGRGASNESKIEEVIWPLGDAVVAGFGCFGGPSKLSKIEEDISADGEAFATVLVRAGASYASNIEDAIWPLGVPEVATLFAGAASNPSNIDDVICPVFPKLELAL